MQLERIFNANVGDDSIGNAGPDGIEQDLDNLYSNKAWNKDVLTRTNTEVYIPTQDYHPATKKYVDDSKQEVADDLNSNVTSLNNRIDTTDSNVQDVVTNFSNFATIVNDKLSNMINLGSYVGDGVTEGQIINFLIVPAIVVIQDNSGDATVTHIIMKDSIYKINIETAAEIGNGTLSVYGALNEVGKEYEYIVLTYGQIQ
jgi:hypothetical protein